LSSLRFCSECGKPLEAGHRFCTNCGSTTSIESNAPTMLKSDQTVLGNDQVQSPQSQASTPAKYTDATASTIITPDANTPGSAVYAPGYMPVTPNTPNSRASYSTVPTSGDQFYGQATEADVIPPPPPPDSFISTPQEAPASPYYTPPAPANKTVPAYAQAPKRSRGCLVASIVLLLVLVLGGIGAFFLIRHNNSTGSNQNGNSASGEQNTPGTAGNTPVNSGITPTSVTTPGSNGNTPSTGSPVTVPLNLKFTYSSVDITLVSVQQASSFPDDSSTPQGGVRVVTKESNSTSNDVRYSYDDVIRLIMPDGSIIAPSNEKSFEAPAAGVSQDNWIDFAVTSQNIDLSKLKLRYGSATENQMNIPFASNADLSKYQPKTVTSNSTLQYAGMNWTLVSATESLSANGQQASTGMVYVTVTLKAVNSSANNFSGYPGDYIRLQSGDSKSPPSNFTFPTSVASQSTGTGVVSFLIPQGGSSFTLLMLAQSSVKAASVNFQLH
jgi:hypothetical protein